MLYLGNTAMKTLHYGFIYPILIYWQYDFFGGTSMSRSVNGGATWTTIF